jgi:hypothetical protein
LNASKRALEWPECQRRLVRPARFELGAVLATVKDASRRCAVAFGHL